MITWVSPLISPRSGSSPVTFRVRSVSPHAAAARPRQTRSRASGRHDMEGTYPNWRAGANPPVEIDRAAGFPRCGGRRPEKILHQVAASQRPAHLRQRLLLELPDPLARQVVLVPDLLE